MFSKIKSSSQGNEAKPVHIFISYKRSPDDEAIKNKLLVYIRSDAEHAGAEFWSDRDISAGDEWEAAIRGALARADIAILLVSQEYLASDFVRDVEVKTLLERRERGELVILPLILSAFNRKAHKWLMDIQYFPTDHETIMEHYQEAGPRNRLFQKFLEILLKCIEEVKATAVRQSLDPSEQRNSQEDTGINLSDDHCKRIPPQTTSGNSAAPQSQCQPQLSALSRPVLLQSVAQQILSSAKNQQAAEIAQNHSQSSIQEAAKTSTFQIISTSITASTQLFNLLKEPITAPTGQIVIFKPTGEKPSHVFFVLEESEVPDYRILHSYLAQDSHAFIIIFIQDNIISAHTLEKKAELLRAEIFARTKVYLEDIYACNLVPNNRNTAKLQHALV